MYVLNDRGAIYVLGDRRARRVRSPRRRWPSWSRWRSWCSWSPVLGGMLFNLLVGARAGVGPRAAAEVRASFYRKLFLAFVAAAIVPGAGAGAGVARLHGDADARRHREGGDAPGRRRQPRGRGRRARSSARQRRGRRHLVVWLSRVIAQDVNIFDGAGPARVERAQPVCVGPAADAARRARCIARSCSTAGPSFVGRETRRRPRIPDRRGAGAARRTARRS